MNGSNGWRGLVVDTPDWWQELEIVLEVDNIQKLAQKMWASFELSHQMSVEHAIENYHHAPPAPHCISLKGFSLTAGPKILLLTPARRTKR